ncbi:MAG TPA: heme-binding protein [Acidobacteria bacterium]|jgi:uncharacterized protein GlcG (DUF336 family)|nr:heme-binding protein [Acidobacteriota bacterium]
MRHLIVTLTLVTATLITLPNANAAEERPILTASAAMTMVHGCLAKAQAEGWLMHIAIIDNHGNLKAYHRMDDAQLLSQDVSLAKARTSAVINQSTKQWGEMAFSGGGPGPAAFVPGMNHFEGGLPIMTSEGTHIGGIGVSGDTGANDAVCAQAGIDAAADDLR